MKTKRYQKSAWKHAKNAHQVPLQLITSNYLIEIAIAKKIGWKILKNLGLNYFVIYTIYWLAYCLPNIKDNFLLHHMSIHNNNSNILQNFWFSRKFGLYWRGRKLKYIYRFLQVLIGWLFPLKYLHIKSLIWADS